MCPHCTHTTHLSFCSMEDSLKCLPVSDKKSTTFMSLYHSMLSNNLQFKFCLHFISIPTDLKQSTLKEQSTFSISIESSQSNSATVVLASLQSWYVPSPTGSWQEGPGVGKHPGNALPDASCIPLQHTWGQPLPLAMATARVSNHTRGPAHLQEVSVYVQTVTSLRYKHASTYRGFGTHNSNGLVAGTLEVDERDEGEEVPQVQAVCRGVKPHVHGPSAPSGTGLKPACVRACVCREDKEQSLFY